MTCYNFLDRELKGVQNLRGLSLFIGMGGYGFGGRHDFFLNPKKYVKKWDQSYLFIQAKK